MEIDEIINRVDEDYISFADQKRGLQRRRHPHFDELCRVARLGAAVEAIFSEKHLMGLLAITYGSQEAETFKRYLKRIREAINKS